MNFLDYWRAQAGEPFAKATLTKAEIQAVQGKIAELQARRLPANKIIAALQKLNPQKLGTEWKAARAFFTEVKRDDTTAIGDTGQEIGFSNYKVILSPNACKVCRIKSQNGRKIFKQSDIEKSGWGHVPPFHPNCYCVLIPKS